MVTYITAFCFSFITGFIFTFLFRTIARKLGIVAHPSPEKMHRIETPLMGGIAVYLAFVCAVFLTLHINRQLAGILIGASFLLIVGLADDIKPLKPKIKLLYQFIAVVPVILCGIRIGFVPNVYLSMFITAIWVVGITNSMNFLDNSNGVLSGTAAIASFGLFFIGIKLNNATLALPALGLAGACLGFLPHNFPRGRIFLGDAGSLSIGFTLASMSITHASQEGYALTQAVVPIALLGVPIVDTCLIVISRLINHRPIWMSDKSHLSFRMLNIGLNKEEATFVHYLLGFAFVTTAVMLVVKLAYHYLLLPWAFSLAAAFFIALSIRHRKSSPKLWKSLSKFDGTEANATAQATKFHQ